MYYNTKDIASKKKVENESSNVSSNVSSNASSNTQTHHHYEWAATVKAEGKHVVQHCGLSYASFSKIKVTGLQSRTLLESMTTAVLPKKPSINQDRPCKLTYGVTPQGRMCTEMTICRNSEEDWYLVGNRDRSVHDVVWYVCLFLVHVFLR